ncbi:unnamed protein product [Tuber aestivum]|uniref:Uncharacterized protein n=1 Tax=Tuber aestivum TaxID=59557 RepID=A0A292PXQ9_9PEZI|nr:unnamed protein product [Tuber aestivum]
MGPAEEEGRSGEAWALLMGRKNWYGGGGGGGGMLQGLMTLNEGKVHEADQGRWEKTGWKRGVCTDNGRGRGEEEEEKRRGEERREVLEQDEERRYYQIE